MHKSHFSLASAGIARVPYHSDRSNGAYRLMQMTRIGRANEDDSNCWLGKADRQSLSRRRPAHLKIEQVGSSSAARRLVTMPAEKVILCRKPFLRKSHASAGFLQLFF